ncbi:MAG TPA: mandelate racemase/muconate lactonizing enzyme family protein [Streptosporangiaceae bacterium]|nr:mandelate racemase/muconate lactonizing enzyme family protein [Streptosporangiaceae bacterium]
MKIEGAQLTFINVPMQQPELWAWGLRDGYTVGLVELHTDAGVTGLGEVVVAMGPNAGVIRAMFDQMLPHYIGESPLDTERIITKIMADGWYSFERTAGLVLGGLDMACWDAAGKFLGQPVSRLLGGQVRTSFDSMYFVPADDDIGVMVQRAAEAVREGFSTIYYKVGIGEERDVELVLRTREAIGPAPRLRVDANESWSPSTAMRILRRMGDAHLEYVEQPILMHDIDGLAHIRRHSGVPVAANQSSWGRHAILEIIRKNAADVLMTDPHQEGGLMAFKKVLALCEIAGLGFVNHAFNVTTITFSSHVQVLSTSAACILALQGHPDYLADDYVQEPMSYTGGKIKVGDRTGLGVELDPDKVRRYHEAFERDGQAVSYADAKAGTIRTIPHL